MKPWMCQADYYFLFIGLSRSAFFANKPTGVVPKQLSALANVTYL
jgi:hypothetical protein